MDDDYDDNDGDDDEEDPVKQGMVECKANELEKVGAWEDDRTSEMVELRGDLETEGTVPSGSSTDYGTDDEDYDDEDYDDNYDEDYDDDDDDDDDEEGTAKAIETMEYAHEEEDLNQWIRDHYDGAMHGDRNEFIASDIERYGVQKAMENDRCVVREQIMDDDVVLDLFGARGSEAIAEATRILSALPGAVDKQPWVVEGKHELEKAGAWEEDRTSEMAELRWDLETEGTVLSGSVQPKRHQSECETVRWENGPRVPW